jgi:two-component system sensor histidine kinase RegB
MQAPLLQKAGAKTELRGISWLLRVRWVAAVGQLLVFGIAQQILEHSLDFLPVIIVSLLIISTNLLLAQPRMQSYAPQRVILASILLFDVLLLTALLAAYGGHTNPFSVVYIVHVILAALLLGSAWSWAISVICSAMYFLLFFYYLPVPELSMHHHGAGGQFSLHLQGMLISFVLTASLVSWFFQHMRKEIDRREYEIERQRAIEDRLAAVTALAATAAHEMGTPLGSMRLIVDDIQSGLNSAGPDFIAKVQTDLDVLSNELERCAHSLRQLVHSSGEHLGEMPSHFNIEEIIQEIANTIPTESEIKIDCTGKTECIQAYLPREALTHVLYSLVKNATEATHDNPQGIVTIATSLSLETFAITITDNGEGITEENLEHLGEPFFSTKSTNGGMGLGIFLAKLFAKRLGGSLSIESTVNLGTTVKLNLPLKAKWSIAA